MLNNYNFNRSALRQGFITRHGSLPVLASAKVQSVFAARLFLKHIYNVVVRSVNLAQVMVLLPGETVLTMCPSFGYSQHGGVSGADEHQFSHSKVPQRPQTAASARTFKPFSPFNAIVVHVFATLQ